MSTTASTPVAQRLVLLDAGSGRTVWARRYPLRRGQSEAHPLFTPNGALITSAQQGETLVWNPRSGKIVRRYPIGGRNALSPDGRQLALALNSPSISTQSSSVAVLDLRTGRQSRLATRLPDQWVLSLAFTPDATRIVAGAIGGTHVWDVASGAIVESYGGPVFGPKPGAVVDRRGLVLAGSGDGSVGVWDAEGARRLGHRFGWSTRENGCPANPCAVLNRQGTVMATSTGDGTVALVDMRTLRSLRPLPAHDGPLANGLAFLPDGRLATGGIAGSVTIWDLARHRSVRRLHYSEPVWSTAVSPDGTLLAVTRQAEGSRDAHVEVRDLASGRALYTRRIRFGLGELYFSHDGRELVSLGCCNRGSTVAGWDARSGAARFERTAPEQTTTFALSPDPDVLAVGTADGRVALWDARNGKQRGAATKVAAGAITQLAFSPDGRQFAAASDDASATLWNVRSRKRFGDVFPVDPGVTPAVAFEPSGRLLNIGLGSAVEWPIDGPTLQRFACQIAGRGLTRAEWRDLLPSRPYQPVCPSPR
jgi:WD40 repeat protein